MRHALDPETELVPVGLGVRERYAAWLADRSAAGVTFSAEQRKWLDAIADHIATSLRVEPDDFQEGGLYDMGGLGKAHQVFGDQLPAILDELNARLAA